MTHINPDAYLIAKHGFYNWTPENHAEAWAEAYQALGAAWGTGEKHLVMLSGIPASGKSTISAQVLNLRRDRIVIFDSTMITRIARSAILNIWKGLGGTVVCIVPYRQIDDIRISNEARTHDRKIPDHAIDRMIAQWQPPCMDEGFERVYVFLKKGDEGSLQPCYRANLSWSTPEPDWLIRKP